jgi:hypothetical protein
VDVDFAAVMERMRRLRAGISPHDSASRFRDLGIDVFFGQGKLTAADRIEVAGETLTFSRAVVATGSRAAAPAIPGLNEVEYLTNESVFSLTKLPKCFAVIGAGPIGCEMAQAFARFGSQVILVESGKGLLPKEDTDASKTILEALKRDGVLFRSGGEELTLSKTDDGRIRLAMHSPDHAHQEVVDKLLIAVGRAPNVEGLGLENAGVEYSNKGVKVNDRLQTTHFCCRGRLFVLSIHARRRLHGSNRDPECFVPGTLESEFACDSMVHLYGTGDRPRRHLGKTGAHEGNRNRNLHPAFGRSGPGDSRQGDRGLRSRACKKGLRHHSSAVSF